MYFNIICSGKLSDSQSIDPKVQGVRQYVKDPGNNPDIIPAGLQTVDCKGYDGFTLSIVNKYKKE